jgi:hypothetical protein
MISFDEASLSELTYNSRVAGSLSLDPFNRPRGGVALYSLLISLITRAGKS